MKLDHVNFFVGFNAATWFALIRRYRRCVSRSNWWTVAALSGISLLNSALKWLEYAVYRKRIEQVSLPASPIFILGHWRCGTTLLHELFASDRRCAFPTSYQSFAPHHFLLTERLFCGSMSRLLEWVTGFHPLRPQDSMPVDYSSPQEDEFALQFMGVGSPYLALLFPSQQADFWRYRTLDSLSETERSRWKASWTCFLKKIMLRSPGKHLVLKSPAHSFRIPTILDIFPDARFVHIVRDPLVVFPSTVHTFQSFARHGALEADQETEWQESAFEMGDHLYATLEQTLGLIPPDRLVEVCYEDLVRDPLDAMRMLYASFGMGEYEEEALPAMQAYLDRVARHTTNRYPLSDGLRDEISRRWVWATKCYQRVSGLRAAKS